MKKLNQIADPSLLIECFKKLNTLQDEKKACIFFEYSGHVNILYVRICLLGYDSSVGADNYGKAKRYDISCDTKKQLSEGLKEINEYINSLPSLDELEKQEESKQLESEQAKYEALKAKFENQKAA